MSPQPPMGDGVDDRRTPPELFARLNNLYDFTLDGAASHENALVDVYCTLEGTFSRGVFKPSPTLIDTENGLLYPWTNSRVFLNPPYGRGLLEPFVHKAHLEALRHRALVVALLPARTEQRWFHEDVLGANASIEWIRGRVKYDGLATGAPFPSMIVTWR